MITGPWQEGWEAEPNNSRNNANELSLEKNINGYFQQKNDYDWFKLINDRPGKSLVKIDLSAVAGVDSKINLYNEKGNRIWSADEAEKKMALSLSLTYPWKLAFIISKSLRGKLISKALIY